MLRFFTTLEKILIVLLTVIVLATSYYLYRLYVVQHSDIIADEGGIFTEGLVGRPQYLNPVLLMGNPVDADISQLLYSGLTRYNPHTGQIEDDIATSEKSKDNLTYTFTLLPDVTWHDGTPVTADDVIYTYRDVIQNEAFSNAGLRQSFSDVTVEKVDERTVEFRLTEPYSFFLANVTVGILPKHLYEFIPVDNLDKTELNQQPIGTGPYRFVSWTVADETHEITLKPYEDFYGPAPKIQTLIFRVFPTEERLLLGENTLTGFRTSSDNALSELEGSRWQIRPYRLPQYTALFLNTESDYLTNKKVRFALLLATDKEAIAEAVGDVEIVDTPILEAKDDLDIEFSLERAMGAFFDTEWNLPYKIQNVEETSDGEGGPETDALLANADELTFVLKAVEDSWISLQVDGTSQPSFLLSQGDAREFTAQDSLTLVTLGNAAGLEITVNGLELEPLGDSGEVLRSLVLDRESIESYLREDQPVLTEPETEPVEEDPGESAVIEDEIIVNEEESREEEGELAQVRVNDSGERLILRLVTVQDPPVFLRVAEMIQRQWLQAGAKVVIETYSLADLQQKIQDRDYDILLFGQNLGYNLDAFPFWHSSQAGNGLNLSNYRSLEVDNLLVDIRRTFDERTKQGYLDQLKRTIAEDTPAVFLYNPTHYYYVDRSVKNVQLGQLSSHADRFNDLGSWYIREQYRLTEPFSFFGLLRWLFSSVPVNSSQASQ